MNLYVKSSSFFQELTGKIKDVWVELPINFKEDRIRVSK